MKNYPNIRAENVISHKEACGRGYASNHGAPEHWLARFGKNMDWFRAMVAPEKRSSSQQKPKLELVRLRESQPTSR